MTSPPAADRLRALSAEWDPWSHTFAASYKDEAPGAILVRALPALADALEVMEGLVDGASAPRANLTVTTELERAGE